jgi:hypothetical protein
MSLLFKPKIADSFEHIKPVVLATIAPKLVEAEPEVVKSKGKPRKKLNPKRVKLVRRPWTTVELKNLIEVKARKVSDKECARIFGRTAKSCRMAIWGRKLMPAIRARRLEMITEVPSGYATRKGVN